MLQTQAAAVSYKEGRACVIVVHVKDSWVTKRRMRLVAGGIEIKKPTMVEKYNMHMGGVNNLFVFLPLPFLLEHTTRML